MENMGSIVETLLFGLSSALYGDIIFLHHSDISDRTSGFKHSNTNEMEINMSESVLLMANFISSDHTKYITLVCSANALFLI